MFGGLKETKTEAASDLTKRSLEATSAQTALNTGPKMRFGFMQRDPGMVYSAAMMAGVILYSGRSAIRDRPETRANAQLKASTPIQCIEHGAALQRLGSQFSRNISPGYVVWSKCYQGLC